MTIFLTSVALMVNGVGVARKPVIKSKNEYLKGLSILLVFAGVATSKDRDACIAGLLNGTENAEPDDEELNDYIKEVKYVDLRKGHDNQ